MHSAPKQSEFVKTCPFGSGFYLPAEQAWRSVKVFHAYQLVLSAAFFGLFITKTGPSIFGQHSEGLFQVTSITYFALSLFGTAIVRKPYIAYARQVQFKIITDIIVLTLLMHASGGITSGLGALLAVSVAAGGLLAGGQCTLAFAAIATFAMLGEQTYADINNVFAQTAYTYAGVLSASFFTIALLAMVLAKRVEVSEKIAQQQSREIEDLIKLNDYIIKHLQSGIIVVDHHNNVRLTNEAAKKLLSRSVVIGQPLSDISTEGWQLYKQWLKVPAGNTATLPATSNSPRIKLRFNQLDSFTDDTNIIFLDDLSSVDHQIQQGKLASLGRLTASIAHEIRNPLGAISHAGELLSESTSIEKEDKRLLDIIHNHTGRVNSIVKSILQVSRQEESHVENFALTPWLIEFKEHFKEQFGLTESPFQTTISRDISDISFDKNHLKQIIDNLCGNALKHGQQNPSKPVISIHCGVLESNQQVFISISDSGEGISEKVAQQIFEPFYTTSSSGTGLGLYISNQLAELNHAKLSYHANEESGSRFTLLLNKL